MNVRPIPPRAAAALVVQHHYLHRRPPISHAYGLAGWDGRLWGAVTFGTPPSRHLQKSACPTNPDAVIELNRLWVDDTCPPNTETWFLSKALRMLPPHIVVSYADPAYGHLGYVYRAANFRYAGWTDMERKTPRLDYVPTASEPPDTLFDVSGADTHTRDAFRNGYTETRRRLPKIRYWTTTGNRTDRRRLAALCGWPSWSWIDNPPPVSIARQTAPTGRRRPGRANTPADPR